MQRFRFPSWQSIRARLALLLIALAYLAIFPGDTPGGNSLNQQVLARAKNVLFNYMAWEADAIAEKVQEQQTAISGSLTEAQRSRFVVDYLALVHQLQNIEGQIAAIYSDPKVADHDAATADLRAKRSRLQQQVNEKLPLAEGIIEEQVASVLRDEGLGTLGLVFPPVSSHITELPMVLVISPRDKIQFEQSVSVVNLTVDDQIKLESQVDHDLDVSSLVVPIGGLSLYPSMVQQTWYAPFVFEVAAHEWTHHYLFFFPLGLNYSDAGDTRTINETTASVAGKEVSRKVILRYYKDYPDILALLPQEATAKPAPTPEKSPTPAQFDFAKALNETRVNVDKLLAEGKIDEAEQYMEARRQIFVANGYTIRKLNQAYFAFYGGYQSPGDTNAGGVDPTGAAIADIRQHSPSLKTWLETMRGITTKAELLATRDSLQMHK